MKASNIDILLINGPNLNLLGQREPHLYGSTTLSDICERLSADAEKGGYALDWMQSNAEAELIDAVQGAASCGVKIILINAASLTHTSIGLRDALAATKIPFIELHLSNIHQREEFRHKSVLADCALGVICGFKALSYDLALAAAIEHLNTHADAEAKS